MKGVKLLSTRQVGEALGFSDRTIARWCRIGDIKAVKVGRVWRIHPNQLRFHLNNQRLSRGIGG